MEGPHVVSWMVVEESDSGIERSTHGKKIPKKSCRSLQGSGGDSGSWTEGAFGDVLRGKYFGGFRGLERRILRYFEVVLFG